MAHEDWIIERNGVEISISKAIRLDKAESNMVKFNKLKFRFGIEVLEIKNNIIRFKMNDNEYYYGLVKSKLRRKGEREWTGKLVATLKQDMKS